MRAAPLVSWAAVAAVLALVMLLGGTDSVRAGTFNPTLAVTPDNTTPETPSGYTTEFNLPEGDVNFAGVVAFIPPEWGVIRGEKIPVGANVGKLTANATLGLINAACNQVVPVEFQMRNGSLDRSDTVGFRDDDDEDTTAEFAEDLNTEDDQTYDAAIFKYPDFLDRIVDAQPIRRSAGITLVAGTPVLLQFLVYPPGTHINDNIPDDPELGFPSVTFLQNAGDPESDPEPGVITDFCTPLVSTNVSDAETPEGQPLWINPTDGVYTWSTIGVGQRDADNDGYENSLDTCVAAANTGNPRTPFDGDLDGDGLDAACDPNDNFEGGTNSDQDSDGYQNRQDNCPLVANGQAEREQAGVGNQDDEDLDQIGDACDANPDTEDGDLAFAQPEVPITIGAGGSGPGEPPSDEACGGPQMCWREGEPALLDENGGTDASQTPGGDSPTDGASPDGTEAPEDNGDDGGSSSTVIIIVAAAIAAVVVLGGGAALMMRRRNGA